MRRKREGRRERLKMAVQTGTRKNEILQYASKMMKNPIAFTDSQLTEDYQLLVNGHAFYLPHFFCESSDYSYLENLTADLQLLPSNSLTNWSKHFKHENPDFSPTFRSIIQILAEYFNVDIYATRLNFYPDSSAWKPFHHDSHAYSGHNKKEDFTIGASFGASRELVFLHPKSKNMFGFPQDNGDIFAFDTKVNQVYQHGVPKATGKTGPRFSVIAWGRRRSLNERNGGTEKVRGDIGIEVKWKEGTEAQEKRKDGKKEVRVEVEKVTELVEEFVAERKGGKGKEKGREEEKKGEGEGGGGTKMNADGPQRRKRVGGNRNQRIGAK
eukprot:TRINITY_DN3721_c0_g1_i1.p1 TRINITY_DN3721_c0_g1~~TRINITY_DN3721_c0_g1_i1.p1  ORF type:complete len:326 (-),score=107.01 TRINITY_DN3721_c0_g1_i1:14-991(-)